MAEIKEQCDQFCEEKLISERKGRGLVAKKDLKEGEVILEEKPLGKHKLEAMPMKKVQTEKSSSRQALCQSATAVR